MKAIRVHQFGGPEVLTSETVPDPEPGPDEVVVRVHAIGVNPVETYLRSGSNPALLLPYTPGTDAAGIIEAAGGSAGREWPAGTRVYTSGSLSGVYAERALCRSTQIHRLPAEVSFEQGAAVNIPYATAWRALVQRARVRPGERILVHGASGGVGLAAVQIGRALGCTVIGSAGTAAGRSLVLREGAHCCLDHSDQSMFDELAELTGGTGPEVILEMLSNVNLARDLQAIAPRGRIVVIGCRGSIEINPREMMTRESDVLGLLLFNATADELREIHAALGAGLANGTLRPVIARRYSLDEAAAAQADILSSGALGKLVLVP